MQFDNPLLTALVFLGLPVLGLNMVAWWWQRRQQDPQFPAEELMALRMPGLALQRPSLAESRLHSTPVLRVVLTVLTFALAMTLIGLTGRVSAVVWPGTLLLGVLVWNTVSVWLWELRFDSLGVSAPSQILWRRSYLWRQLLRVTDDNPFAWHFHFADGAILRIPKQITGRDELMQTARRWLEIGNRDGVGVGR